MLLKDRFLRFWQLNCDNFKYCQNGENTFETLDIFLHNLGLEGNERNV